MSLSTIAGLAGSAASNLVRTAGSSVVENLVSTGYSYLHGHMLADDSEAELKKLQTALPKITAVMAIAEALKMNHPSASLWVDQFRKAVEASEDVLDELEYKKLEDMVKNRDEAEGSASSSKKRKLHTTNDPLERLKEAITMLNRASDGVEGLLQLASFKSLSESQQEFGKVLRRQTTSFLPEIEMFGREVEKNEIIDWLKRPTDVRLSSFSIVGVGGQGKTTLAQFAYQEMLKEKQFDKTIWVCVSTNFSVEDVTRKMLSESNSSKPLNALQKSLKDMVLSKKILLVLDDVWEDKRRWDWEQLIAPLKFVQQGSKIIFTTRMKSVAELLANVINTDHKSLELEGLGEQELRLLFDSYAFRGFNPDNHRNLQILADQILKLLRRSPLAAKVIGSLLNSRMDHQYWRKFLNHGSLFNLEQVKDVMDVLKLSYYHLPADLQVCFRFCSIFPQDHLFDKDDLIKMWIAAGFIRQQSSQGKNLEDIGEDYFNLLLRKSFFECSHTKQGERYVMHDLMHDLASNVSTGECCRIEPNNKSITIHSTVRHVSVRGSEIDRVSNLGNLRSLVIIIEGDSEFVLLSNSIKKPLRLLKINGYGSFELPKEMSCLVHLRYLSIEIESLKCSSLTSVCKPVRLQLLNILNKLKLRNPRNCDYSGIETAGMSNLLMLRYLRLPKGIMQTIHGVHKLTFLGELTFFVGQESGQHINELEKLNSIQHLSIENIDNIEDPNEAKCANLLEKTNLVSLSLKWTSKSNSDNPEQIINYLQPHPNLTKLTVEYYKGQRSPSWMNDSSPFNLSSVKFSNCPVWKNQLSSWKMPYLESFDIFNCPNLDMLPNMPLSLIEFRVHKVGLTTLPDLHQTAGNNTPQPLSLKSSLREVVIESCPNLMSLNGFLQQDNLDLQSIVELTISGCEKLVLVPEDTFGKLLSLRQLRIKNCQNLTECPSLPLSLNLFEIKNVGVSALPGYYQSSDSRGGPSTSSSLRKVSIENCPKLTALNGFLQSDNINFQSLWDITIKNCKNLVDIPIGVFGKFGSLISLFIDKCPMLKAVDNQSTLLPPSLKNLSIENCSELDVTLLESASRLTTLIELSIVNCANKLEVNDSSSIEELSEQWLQQNNSTLKKLNIWSANIWSAKSLPATMSRLTVLEELRINGADSLEHILELPTSLRSLTIMSSRSLKSLPATMARLTVLKELEINGADSLEHIPELPASLRSLNIGPCRSLKSLPATMARLTVLEKLRINGADSLEHIPELPASLRSLTIWSSRSLKSLPATMARLTVLEELRINGADSLEHILELPTSLRSLTIMSSRSLKSLPATMARLAVLEELRINGADSLEHIPELPASLRSLTIWSSRSLKSLPATMARLAVLEELRINGADSLEHIPELPASLRSLNIGPCRSLKSLPATMARLTVLEELRINGADSLEHILELPTSLRSLTIMSSRSLKSLPATMARLTVLKELEINGADSLEHIPELPASLRSLNIGPCRSLKSLPATMARLTVLKELEINGADSLEHIPELPASLRSLNIGPCRSLKSLPATMARLTVLKELEINGADSLEHIPELPASLRSLTIWSSRSLKSLPATMARLAVLKELEINGADSLEHIPELPASLRSLNIGPCRSLKSLPATMARLTVLEELRINGADSLEHILELPTSLRSLTIMSSRSLKSLPATMARLTVLKELEINGADSLEHIPELPASLRSLNIGPCRSLKSLPATMARLTVLEKLRINGADSLEHIPELPASLRSLTIWSSRSLKSLPATMARLTVLEELRINGADSLEHILELPTSLRSLTIMSSRSLKSLPATMARLTVLEKLKINGADSLEHIPELPASLRDLYIGNASSLKSLAASTLMSLTALERLEIEKADVEELPELPASLRVLIIYDARSLKSLPATMARLTALRELTIWDAHLLEELPELPGSLRELIIGDASSLKSLPATMARLTALRELTIWNAHLLEELPELPASLEVKNIEGRDGRWL